MRIIVTDTSMRMLLEFNTENNVNSSMEIYSDLGELDVFWYKKVGSGRE